MSLLKASEVKEAIRDWREVLAHLAPEIKTESKRHQPCPVHGGKDGFRLFNDSAATGGGICNSCGAFPDGFALLMWLKGWDFPTALEEVASSIGFSSKQPRKTMSFSTVQRPKKAEPSEKEKEEAARKKAMIEKVWEESKPLIAVDEATQYLRKRGIVLRLSNTSNSLRGSKSEPLYEAKENGGYRLVGNFPAMVAAITGKDGEIVTLHRTYLTPNGHIKKIMAIPNGKTISGGAVRLGSPQNGVLGIAEGIETALSVQRGTNTPCWASVTAIGLENFVPPKGVSKVIVWTDKDRTETGEKAASVLKERLKKDGIEVEIKLPMSNIPEGAKSIDWNDVLQLHGRDGFPVV